MAAFGVDTSRSFVAPQNQSDPVLQVSGALIVTLLPSLIMLSLAVLLGSCILAMSLPAS